jgi:hypothetical protein
MRSPSPGFQLINFFRVVAFLRDGDFNLCFVFLYLDAIPVPWLSIDQFVFRFGRFVRRPGFILGCPK